MNTHGYIRTVVCALLAVIAGLTALSTGAFANGLRSGSNLPKIEQRHAVGKKQQNNKARRHHARHHAKGKTGGGTIVSIPGTGTGGQESSGGGTATPGTGTGTGTGGKKTRPTKPTTPPVTETPSTPPVTETPPVTTPPIETPSTPPTSPSQSINCFSSPHL